MVQLCIALARYSRSSCSERNERRGIDVSLASRERREKRLDWHTSYLYQLGVLLRNPTRVSSIPQSTQHLDFSVNLHLFTSSIMTSVPRCPSLYFARVMQSFWSRLMPYSSCLFSQCYCITNGCRSRIAFPYFHYHVQDWLRHWPPSPPSRPLNGSPVDLLPAWRSDPF